jgi:LacI family transcriptional regulator
MYSLDMTLGFLTETPRIVLVSSAALKSNRDKLAGVFQYVQLHTPWNIQLVDQKIDEQTVSKIRNWCPSGIIVGRMSETVRDILAFKVPIVVMDSRRNVAAGPLRNVHFITCDAEAIARAGADYLKRKGFTRFAYICDKQGSGWALERGRFFKAQLEREALECALFTPRRASGRHASGKDWEEEQDRLTAWLLGLPKQTAVLAANDSLGREVLDLCQLAGIQVPSDLAVLGCDNDESLCENTNPPLSSIEPDFGACGYQAAQLLERLMLRGAALPHSFFYGAKRLVERESTQFRTVALDGRIRKGLDFIRLNAVRMIGVGDIACQMGVSRRSAELLFRRQLGHSIVKEIQLARVERLKRLLVETNRPITMLCGLCGYQSEAHAKRLFKSVTGFSMSEFRKRQKPRPPR